jgi:hypothetical protein
MTSNLDSYRWEYSPPARWGDFIWARLIDPALRVFGDDGLTALRRLRGVMQIVVLLAILLVPVSFFWKPSHLLAASGLLFDIAGVLRLFLLEEIDGTVVGRIFKANATPVGASWMWTLAFGHYEDRTPTHGYAETREAVMAAFAKSWRRE